MQKELSEDIVAAPLALATNSRMTMMLTICVYPSPYLLAILLIVTNRILLNGLRTARYCECTCGSMGQYVNPCLYWTVLRDQRKTPGNGVGSVPHSYVNSRILIKAHLLDLCYYSPITVQWFLPPLHFQTQPRVCYLIGFSV